MCAQRWERFLVTGVLLMALLTGSTGCARQIEARYHYTQLSLLKSGEANSKELINSLSPHARAQCLGNLSIQGKGLLTDALQAVKASQYLTFLSDYLSARLRARVERHTAFYTSHVETSVYARQELEEPFIFAEQCFVFERRGKPQTGSQAPGEVLFRFVGKMVPVDANGLYTRGEYNAFKIIPVEVRFKVPAVVLCHPEQDGTCQIGMSIIASGDSIGFHEGRAEQLTLFQNEPILPADKFRYKPGETLVRQYTLAADNNTLEVVDMGSGGAAAEHRATYRLNLHFESLMLPTWSEHGANKAGHVRLQVMALEVARVGFVLQFLHDVLRSGDSPEIHDESFSVAAREALGALR